MVQISKIYKSSYPCGLLVILILSLSSLIKVIQASTRGDFCIGTSTEGCDNLNTNLYCIEGKCTCPDYLTHHYADLRSGLSTWWDKDRNKCVSLKGGICHLITEENKSSPGIPCQSQHKCVPSSTNSGPMGKCGGSSNDASSTATVRISTILSFLIIGLGFGFFKD